MFRSKPVNYYLVITDMTMPNLTGDKPAIELMEVRSNIPVIVCTGYSKKRSDDSKLGIGINALAYIQIVKEDLAKPFGKCWMRLKVMRGDKTCFFDESV